MLQLMDHQERMVQISEDVRRFYLAWSPGVGKTIAIYAMIHRAIRNGETPKVLILAPKSILQAAWMRDGEHFPDIHKAVIWHQNAARRKAQIAAPWQVGITNYECFRAHAQAFLDAGVNFLCIDEASKIKNHDAKITKLCQWFAMQKQITRVNLLSGTGAPNNETEWISQLITIDPSIFHSTNFYKVAFHYFAPIKKFIMGKARIVGWKLMAHKRQEFLDKLKSVSWALAREDCIDLPPEQDIVRMIQLDDAESTAYASSLEDLRVELADGQILGIKAQAKLMKLRQLSSGLFYDTAGGGVHVVGRSKLDALGELLDELGHEPVVIWAEFTAEIDAIAALLQSRGVTSAVIDGRGPMEARTAAIAGLQAGQLQYLVCHPAAAGHGVTLTAAANDVFFSLSFSFETHTQALARIYRKGQTRKVVHHYLLAQGTVDETILMALQNKRDLSEAVMEYLKVRPLKEVA